MVPKVARGLAKITSTLGDSGWFKENTDPLDRQLALGEVFIITHYPCISNGKARNTGILPLEETCRRDIFL